MIPGIVAGGISGLSPQVAVPFYSSDFMTSSGWGTSYWPIAAHHSGVTYIAWVFIGNAAGSPIGTRKGVHIAAYDHISDTWSDRYTAGNFELSNDDHGNPGIVFDADGYLHCFFGAHADSIKYSVSTSADNHTKWTARPDISGPVTYPRPVLVGSVIYLFHRNDSDATRRVLTLRTATPASGIATFSSPSSIIDLGADSRVYLTEARASGTDIHFTATRADAADTVRKHVYYFVYDTTDGSVSNFDGSVSVASGSLPVDLSTANSSFRIFDSGSNDGSMPSFCFDSSGNSHVLFTDGSGSSYDLKHMMLSGGSWSSPVIIATLTDRFPGFGAVTHYSVVPGASGEIEAWYPNDSNNMSRRVRSVAGSWGPEQEIAIPSAFRYAQSASVLNGHADLRVVFGQSVDSSTDSDAELLDLHAYGDGGSIYEIDQATIDGDWPLVALLPAFGAMDQSISLIDEGPQTFKATFFGNAKIDTAASMFSQSSLLLDGSGDYVSFPTSSSWRVESGDFTFECWVRPNELGRNQAFMNRRTAAGFGGWALGQAGSNVLFFQMFNSSGSAVLALTGTTTFTTGTWYHVAACRSGTTTRLFFNGALEASGTESATPGSNTQALGIGRDWFNTGRDLNGRLEEIRITRSARYTSAFTPPSAPFPRR